MRALGRKYCVSAKLSKAIFVLIESAISSKIAFHEFADAAFDLQFCRYGVFRSFEVIFFSIILIEKRERE